MKETTLLILLDACRWDYLNEEATPTLWEMAQNGIYVQKLKPNFGFCERSEIFTGTHPDINSNFTAITYDPEKSPLGNKDLSILSFLDRITFSRKYVRYLLGKRYFRKRYKFPIYEIPLRLLPLLSLTEDGRDHRQGGAFIVESIFDVTIERGKSFYYDSFTSLTLHNGSDNDRCQMVIEHIPDEKDLYLLFFGAIDTCGHYYGTNSAQRVQTVKKVDTQIALVAKDFNKHFDNVNFVIIGDHGMIETKIYVDVWRDIKQMEKRYGYRNGEDFVMFLDSTLARFWVFDRNVKRAITKLLTQDKYLKHGKKISNNIVAALHIPKLGYYGDLIWWANPGVVIYPDYFHRRKPVKAMHGYEPSIDKQKGFAIVWRRDIRNCLIKEAELIDICPTLCDIFGMRYPKDNQGKSLLKRL